MRLTAYQVRVLGSLPELIKMYPVKSGGTNHIEAEKLDKHLVKYDIMSQYADTAERGQARWRYRKEASILSRSTYWHGESFQMTGIRGYRGPTLIMHCDVAQEHLLRHRIIQDIAMYVASYAKDKQGIISCLDEDIGLVNSLISIASESCTTAITQALSRFDMDVTSIIEMAGTPPRMVR